MHIPTSAELRAFAHKMADEGFPVFPVKKNKTPITPNGLKDASLDPDQIDEWWDSWPDANVAVATGGKLVVIDVDGPAGLKSLAELKQELGELPSTRTFSTPSGGYHYWFTKPDLLPIKSNAGVVAPGIDIRAEGGYVVAFGHGRYVKSSGARVDGCWSMQVDDDAEPLLPAWTSKLNSKKSINGSGNGHDRISKIESGAAWHEPVRDTVARWVSKGLSDREILLLAQTFQRPGYTLEQTEMEISEFIRGAREKGFAPIPVDIDQPKKIKKLPNMPLELWDRRPTLKAIFDYARYKRVSPDAALGYLFARYGAMLPPDVRVDTGILSPASIIVFSVLITSSGGGKSSIGSLFSDAIRWDAGDFADDLPLGSGEGLAEAYMGEVESGRCTQNGKPIMERRQVRQNAFFVADEGAVIKKLASREGSTLDTTLRSAFSGKTIGSANASRETTRKVTGYSFGLVVMLTPGASSALLAEAEAGSPQRYLWFSASDINAPDMVVRSYIPQIKLPLPGTIVRPCASICRRIEAHRLAVLRGEILNDDLDGQRPLIHVRIASILCLWENKTVITEEDWEIAELILQSSDAIRDAAIEIAVDERATNNKIKGIEAGIARKATEQTDSLLRRNAVKLAKKVHAEGHLTNRQMMRLISNEARAVLPDIKAIMIEEGWVVENCTRFIPGNNTPPETA